MNEHLDAVRRDLDTGAVSAETLVFLFRGAEEAEQQGDVDDLERARDLAQHLAGRVDARLAPEAERLLALCQERLERARAARDAAGSAAGSGVSSCPGCGRPVDASAVRCRSCGTLLV